MIKNQGWRNEIQVCYSDNIILSKIVTQLTRILTWAVDYTIVIVFSYLMKKIRYGIQIGQVYFK
ncbi:hypothetical protein WB91_01015 [bacteria symbiont BFo1 of Frankliniella occidentalis]|nr:hypothetical protein WB91_01015 [bacteria symbiont BFo1 of Frankliniella occidentalis]